jgi:hypothetical protein
MSATYGWQCPKCYGRIEGSNLKRFEAEVDLHTCPVDAPDVVTVAIEEDDARDRLEDAINAAIDVYEKETKEHVRQVTVFNLGSAGVRDVSIVSDSDLLDMPHMWGTPR